MWENDENTAQKTAVYGICAFTGRKMMDEIICSLVFLSVYLKLICKSWPLGQWHPKKAPRSIWKKKEQKINWWYVGTRQTRTRTPQSKNSDKWHHAPCMLLFFGFRQMNPSNGFRYFSVFGTVFFSLYWLALSHPILMHSYIQTPMFVTLGMWLSHCLKHFLINNSLRAGRPRTVGVNEIECVCACVCAHVSNVKHNASCSLVSLRMKWPCGWFGTWRKITQTLKMLRDKSISEFWLENISSQNSAKKPLPKFVWESHYECAANTRFKELKIYSPFADLPIWNWLFCF